MEILFGTIYSQILVDSWLPHIVISFFFFHCYCCLLPGLLFLRYLPLVVIGENFVVLIKDYSGDFDFGPWFFTPHVEGVFPR